MNPRSLRASAQRIAPLAWPVLIGQISVVAFATIDTALVARHSADDLSALAVGSAIYVTIFVGLMGVVLAVGPTVGQMFGARRLAEAGHQLHQAIWLALALSILGSALLLFPTPLLALAGASAELGTKVRSYLALLALSLPASLLFTCYRGFNTAVSRPKAVMALQVGGLAIKIPLSWMFISGVPVLGLPAMGMVGCGLSTLLSMWMQLLLAHLILRRDPFYQPFALGGLRLPAPHAPSLRALLRLGIPMGLSILIEVTAMSMMTIFIARLSERGVAGHQIAVNLLSLMFMMPLALSNATGTLVAQRIGAGDLRDARRLGWHGLELALGIAAVMGGLTYLARESVLGLYTDNRQIIAAAMPLLAWMALFHVSDAAQTMACFVLRAWRIATVPLLIYAFSLWGLGLGGGYVLANNTPGFIPLALQGAQGFWVAGTLGMAVAGIALSLFLIWVLRQRQHRNAVPAS